MSEPVFPPDADACLMLADGTLFFGRGFGASSTVGGELCFNTGMTGYQETLSDPSYAGQIIVFTFPHIGNTGCNDDDLESQSLSAPVGGFQRGAAGLVIREPITEPSNWRSACHFDAWLAKQNIGGISGVDTRALTRHIRMKGAQNAVIKRWSSAVDRLSLKEELVALGEAVRNMSSMEGMELAKFVSTPESYHWQQGTWNPSRPTTNDQRPTPFHVVAIDFGEKLNILRSLAERGCRVSVVPAATPATEILAMKPDGVFLSNGPGDPSATAAYAVPTIKAIIDAEVPTFGICLGHQLLGLAVGAKTSKMHQGHRGANHPVKNLETGAVEITSQNHGFCVDANTLPANVQATHVSLFDGCLEGFKLKDKPAFAVQYHPESSPGPHDSQYLFDRFVELMEKKRA